MAWLNKDGASPSGPVQTDTVKRTFDIPVKMRVRNLAEPIQATLLHIAVSGCRLHSTMQMERGTALSFDWRLSNGKLLNVAGVVAARYPAKDGGPGFEYAIAVEAMAEDDANALAREAAMLVRSASARSYDTALVDISQFIGYRVPDDVKVAYRIDNPRTFGLGQACDITGNALRLRCSDPLRRDETVYLSVRLPDVVLNVHKGSDDELVTAPMTHKRIPRKLLRRPFEEIQLRGRITGSVKDSKRRDAYEVELLDVDGLARQELARYIHASQLARIKK
jgi:hypothetical protein